MSGYIGPAPVPQATQTRQAFTATSGQTTFNTAGYTPGYVDVYLNGVKLAAADYTATNGSDIVLAAGAAASDILEVVAFEIFQVADQDFTGDFSVDTDTLYVDSTNDRVGIGNTSPSTKLHVTGASYPYVRITNDGYTGLDIGQTDSSEGGAGVIKLRDSNPLLFYTADLVRMAIDGSGSVGIGTNSPDTKLHVSDGHLRVAGTETSGSFLNMSASNTGSDGVTILASYYGSGSYGPIKLRTGGSERMRIDSSGNVLIGTTNADVGGSVTGIRLLQSGAIFTSTDETTTLFSQPIYADRRGTNNEGDILALGLGGFLKASIGVLGTNSGSNNGGITFNTISNNATKEERMRINSIGNVGIGNTNPSVKLDVQSTSGIIGRIQSTSGDSQFNIVTPDANEGILAFGDAANYRASIKANTSDAITFQTGSSLTERMRIDSSGNVGIGTPNPSVQFQVGSEYYGTPYLDIMKVWRTADLQGYKNTYPDGGSISYTWYGSSLVKVDTSVGSHNFDIGEVYLDAGTYFILMQYRPSPDQHGWNVYGTNSNGHEIRLQSNAGYNSYNTHASVYAQLHKDDENSRRFRSGTYTVTSAGKFRIGMQTQPYVTGGYKYWVENAYLMKMS